jgi:magnesium transporter
MSVLVLNEKLNFTATAGILLCLLGAIVVVIHGPKSNSVGNLTEFFQYVFAPGCLELIVGFLVYTFFIALLMGWLVFKVGPKYGHVHPAIYLSITAIGSAYLVAGSQGTDFLILVLEWRLYTA